MGFVNGFLLWINPFEVVDDNAHPRWRPAHTSLLQPIWSHPAQGNGQKQAKKGSFGPKVPLLVALEVLGGRRGPYLVTTVTGCSACVGLMVITHFGLILGLLCMVWYVIWFYCMVLRWILFHSIALQCIAWHFIVLYHMALYCIVFDIIAVYCMSPHCILWYGMVLYFIWSYCTVSHCYVPLLQRAGELPRSASSHFSIQPFMHIIWEYKWRQVRQMQPVWICIHSGNNFRTLLEISLW